MLAPERQYVEWEEHLDGDPETCFPVCARTSWWPWPLLWLCFIEDISQSQNEDLDSVL